MRNTSLTAYLELDCKETQADAVFETIKRMGAASNNDISRITGIRINAVCGRARELEKNGKIEVKGYKRDEITRKKNIIRGLCIA